MGIFGAIGKVLTGKPVFDPKQTEDPFGQRDSMQRQMNRPVSAESVVHVEAHKVPPAVRIGRIENHVSGARLEVYADLRNESAEPIFLDFIVILEVKRQLDTQLAPRQSRQFLVYAGPLLHEVPHRYAEIQYRTVTDGDYFLDRHEIRVRPEGVNGYFVTECLLRGPIEDK